ncbi:MAG: SRPBCC domain-containing protein [Planctomycetes bacterium]|nr:SRPBCC domain-containing protein [Planctomycetota bacterium]
MARALRVDKSIVIRCPRERLFAAISRAAELSRWFADRVSADMQAGSAVEFTWGAGRTAHRLRAQVLRVSGGRSVMLRWEDSRAHSRDDYFSISLEERRSGVAVVVVDFATKDTRAELEEIWDGCLAKLKETYEGEA